MLFVRLLIMRSSNNSDTYDVMRYNDIIDGKSSCLEVVIDDVFVLIIIFLIIIIG